MGSDGSEQGIGDPRGSEFDRRSQREFLTRRSGRHEALAKGAFSMPMDATTGIWVIAILILVLILMRK